MSLRRTLQVVGVRVEATKAGKVVKKLRGQLLNVPKLRNVVPDPGSDGMKLVLLSAKERNPETLQPLRETLAGFLRANSFSFVSHAVQIDCSEDAKETVNRVVMTLPVGDVTFRPIDKDNVQQLREMDEKLFPIEYGKAFYEYVTDATEGFCKLAYADDTVIGTVCCEVEGVKIVGKRRYRLYILTIGVTEECRRSKLGSLLLESVIAQARKDRLAYVYLHVHCSNTAAQRFYFAHGFEVIKLMRDYYSQLTPPHCFLLRKQLTPSYAV